MCCGKLRARRGAREPAREAYSLYVERCGRPSNEVWRHKLPQHSLAADLAEEVAQLGNDELLESEAAGVRGTGQREERAALDYAGLGAREHGGGADLLVGEH